MIDPPESKSGLKAPKGKADVLVTQDKSLGEKLSGGKSFLIFAAGEYEVKDTFIRGIRVQAPKKNKGKKKNKDKEEKLTDPYVVYVINLDGLNVLHLNSMSGSSIPDDVLEEIGNVDICLVPVGGKGVLDAEDANRVIKQIEPRVVIPSSYKTPGLKTSRDTVQKFLKALGKDKVKPLSRFVIKRKDLSPEEMQFVVLQPM